jgi:hypothetical protein
MHFHDIFDVLKDDEISLIRSRFGLVFIKKSNQTEIFFLKQETETEPKPGQTDWFRFGLVF